MTFISISATHKPTPTPTHEPTKKVFTGVPTPSSSLPSFKIIWAVLLCCCEFTLHPTPSEFTLQPTPSLITLQPTPTNFDPLLFTSEPSYAPTNIPTLGNFNIRYKH